MLFPFPSFSFLFHPFPSFSILFLVVFNSFPSVSVFFHTFPPHHLGGAQCASSAASQPSAALAESSSKQVQSDVAERQLRQRTMEPRLSCTVCQKYWGEQEGSGARWVPLPQVNEGHPWSSKVFMSPMSPKSIHFVVENLVVTI